LAKRAEQDAEAEDTVAESVDYERLDRVRDFQRRYAAAYKYARFLLVLRWLLPSLMLALAVYGATKPLGPPASWSEADWWSTVPTLLYAATLFVLLTVAAALVRVLVDTAISLVPGLAEEERLGLIDGLREGR